jgi:hypothetical protein
VTDGPHFVTHYQCVHYEIVANNTFPIIALCETVLANESKNAIVVHCDDGAQRSSVIISILSIFQQIKLDKRVDVFQTARWTKLQRCGSFENFVSFDTFKKLCCSVNPFRA